MDQELLAIIVALSVYTATQLTKWGLPKIPQWLVPVVVVPLLTTAAGFITDWQAGGGSIVIQYLIGFAAAFVNSILSQVKKGVTGVSTSVGEAARSAPFWILVCLGLGGAFAAPAQAQEAGDRFWSFPEPKIVPASVLTKLVEAEGGDGAIGAEVMPALGIGLAAAWIEMGEDTTGADDIEILNASLTLFAGPTVGGHFTGTPAFLTSWFESLFTIGVGYDLGKLAYERSRWAVLFGVQWEL